MNVMKENQQTLTKCFERSFIVLFSILSLCSIVNAQDFKLGVINTQKVVENYNKAIEADTELKTLQDRLAGRLKKLEDEIVTMEERLTKQELFLDEDAVRSAKADIVRKQDEYRQKLQVGQESLMEKQKELLEPILQEVKDLIIEIGKQEKYSLILDKQAAMFVESKYDLTDSLIQQLNQKYKKDKQNKEKSNE
ncbi:hypothetical protein CMK22_00395 [Candidatus Poribacteria bacterium]|nr:hypothetical protein [Candidatus Poribacteria bacterium]